MGATVPKDAEPVWILGTADGTQSCDIVCQTVAVEKCGPSHNQRCTQPPVCMKQPLESIGLDSSCDLARSARTAVGDVTPIDHCKSCIVDDWGVSKQAANCQPGISRIMDTSGEYSWYFKGAVVSDVCADIYTVEQTQPICPCYAADLTPTPRPLAVGWVISASILATLALTLAALYVSHRRGDARATMYATHMWGLVRDGWAFTRGGINNRVGSEQAQRRQLAGAATQDVARAQSVCQVAVLKYAQRGHPGPFHHAAASGNAPRLQALLDEAARAEASDGRAVASAVALSELDVGDHRLYTPFISACAGARTSLPHITACRVTAPSLRYEGRSKELSKHLLPRHMQVGTSNARRYY